MNEPMQIPRWIAVGIFVPLILTAIGNGVGSYYGLQYLSRTVSRLDTTVNSLPNQKDMNFALYRLNQIQAHQQEQDVRLNDMHDQAIENHNLAKSAFSMASDNRRSIQHREGKDMSWKPPMPYPNNEPARYAVAMSKRWRMNGAIGLVGPY